MTKTTNLIGWAMSFSLGYLLGTNVGHQQAATNVSRAALSSALASSLFPEKVSAKACAELFTQQPPISHVRNFRIFQDDDSLAIDDDDAANTKDDDIATLVSAVRAKQPQPLVPDRRQVQEQPQEHPAVPVPEQNPAQPIHPTHQLDSSSSSQASDSEQWASIEIFRGMQKEPPFYKRWNGQAKQDQLVASLLGNLTQNNNGEPGFFVDLAANHPIRLSNTFQLEHKLGWKGLCIEANPEYWSSLAYMRNCQVVAAVVGSVRMEQVRFRFRNVMGGMVGKEFDNKGMNNNIKPASRNDREELLYTVPLQDVLKRFHAPKVIQYLSLDVEGAEEFVMQNFTFSEYTFQLVTVERPSRNLVSLLRRSNYRVLKKVADFGDVMFAHESVLPMLDLKKVGLSDEITWKDVDRGQQQNELDWKKFA